MNSPTARWRKRCPRFDEIAVAAGVSVATVDRVLNERGSVSPAARERVVAAARQLGVGRVLPELHHKLVRIDLLLPLNETPFFLQLNDALQQHIQMLDRRVLVLHSRSDYCAHEAGQRGCTEELMKTDLRCEVTAETGDSGCFTPQSMKVSRTQQSPPTTDLPNNPGFLS